MSSQVCFKYPLLPELSTGDQKSSAPGWWPTTGRHFVGLIRPRQNSKSLRASSSCATHSRLHWCPNCAVRLLTTCHELFRGAIVFLRSCQKLFIFDWWRRTPTRELLSLFSTDPLRSNMLFCQNYSRLITIKYAADLFVPGYPKSVQALSSAVWS
jgi:hypothetical protein